ncbi:hypothetical protein [Natrinema longum]|uniref:Uncharacterized protein n=1 Tax=Natrinema longum TaxID=370324 RepID=A0A8A2UBE1_9EURY|nr:hypothetical protein [Natrinema longum]MBZ6496021.1 hypothetical protein [Natrinema longum]QSW86049.1 hypothetical protein J0X27_04235 [Natrinema longum]
MAFNLDFDIRDSADDALRDATDGNVGISDDFTSTEDSGGIRNVATTGAVEGFSATDSAVKTGSEAVLDNDRFSVQDTVRTGLAQAPMSAAASIKQGEPTWVNDDQVAEGFQQVDQSITNTIDSAVEGTPADNPATDAVRWAGDTLVGDALRIGVGTATGIDTEEGTTDYTPGALEAADIGLTLGTAGAGSAALRGGTRSLDSATSAVGRLTSRFGDDAGDAGRLMTDGGRSVDDIGSAADDTPQLVPSGEDALSFGSGADDARDAASRGVDDVMDVFNRNADDAGRSTDDAATVVDDTVDDAGRAADDTGSQLTLDASARSADDAGSLSGRIRSAISRDGDGLASRVSRSTDDVGSTAARSGDDFGSTAARTGDDAGSTFTRTGDDVGSAVSRSGDDVGSTFTRSSDDIGSTVTRSGDDVARTADDSSSLFSRIRDSRYARYGAAGGVIGGGIVAGGTLASMVMGGSDEPGDDERQGAGWGDPEPIAELEGGWVLSRQEQTTGSDDRYFVAGGPSSGEQFLAAGGEAVQPDPDATLDDVPSFDTESAARQAHQAWLEQAGSASDSDGSGEWDELEALEELGNGWVLWRQEKIDGTDRRFFVTREHSSGIEVLLSGGNAEVVDGQTPIEELPSFPSESDARTAYQAWLEANSGGGRGSQGGRGGQERADGGGEQAESGEWTEWTEYEVVEPWYILRREHTGNGSVEFVIAGADGNGNTVFLGPDGEIVDEPHIYSSEEDVQAALDAYQQNAENGNTDESKQPTGEQPDQRDVQEGTNEGWSEWEWVEAVEPWHIYARAHRDGEQVEFLAAGDLGDGTTVYLGSDGDVVDEPDIFESADEIQTALKAYYQAVQNGEIPAERQPTGAEPPLKQVREDAAAATGGILSWITDNPVRMVGIAVILIAAAYYYNYYYRDEPIDWGDENDAGDESVMDMGADG